MFKKILIVIAIILIGGFSAVFTDRYLFPKLASSQFFQKYSFLRKTAENVTVINKTEQVFVKEESSIEKIANSSLSSVVEIISYSDLEAKSDSHPQEKFGAGIIVTSDGLIMSHSSAVSSEFSKYKVLTNDGNSYDAELKKIDSWSGLTFLKISAGNLPSISFGNSSETKPGEKVLAIGRSFSKSGLSFSSGVVSDFDPTFNLAGKTLSSSEKLEGVFRTDMVLGENFSGGPLLDYSGQAIGLTGSLQFDGKVLYFHIPSEKIKLAVDRFLEGGFQDSPTLGVYYIPLTREYSLAHNLKKDRGALIFSPSGQQGLAVIFESSAEKAGLRLGDIILKVGDDEIGLEKSFSDLIYKYKKGEEIELTISRDGQEIKIKIQI